MFPASLLKNKAEVAHMTRTTAREIAIQLGFAAAATGEEPHELLDRFFEKEHYLMFKKRLAILKERK